MSICACLMPKPMRRGLNTCRLGVKGGHELASGCWESNVGPQKEQVFLTRCWVISLALFFFLNQLATEVCLYCGLWLSCHTRHWRCVIICFLATSLSRYHKHSWNITTTTRSLPCHRTWDSHLVSGSSIASNYVGLLKDGKGPQTRYHTSDDIIPTHLSQTSQIKCSEAVLRTPMSYQAPLPDSQSHT